MAYKKLIDSQITTGASTEYNWPGGLGYFSAVHGGVGAVQLEMTPDGTNWFAVPIHGSTSIVEHSTADGTKSFNLPGPTRVRGTITTASTSTGISAWVSG